jgi:hypothetical protein
LNIKRHWHSILVVVLGAGKLHLAHEVTHALVPWMLMVMWHAVHLPIAILRCQAVFILALFYRPSSQVNIFDRRGCGWLSLLLFPFIFLFRFLVIRLLHLLLFLLLAGVSILFIWWHRQFLNL